jgi:hypothetical protein
VAAAGGGLYDHDRSDRQRQARPAAFPDQVAILIGGSQLLDKSVEPHWRIIVNILGLRALPIILQPVTA